MGARRHGQEGHLPLPGNVVKCFLCISSYSKTISRPIIYALLSQFFVGFWGLCPQIPTVDPSLDPAGGLSSPDRLICPHLEKIVRAPVHCLLYNHYILSCWGSHKTLALTDCFASLNKQFRIGTSNDHDQNCYASTV